MTKQTAEIFAKNLNRYMKLYNMNQSDVARLTGSTHQVVSRWCSGKTLPRMGKIQILADHFGIYKSELLEEQNAENINRVQRLKQFTRLYNELTEDEAEELFRYAEFIKSKRK